MKKMKILFAMSLLFFSSIQADELHDLIKTCKLKFSKTAQRDQKIDVIILAALDNEHGKWKPYITPLEEPMESIRAYSPASEPSTSPKIYLQFSELHYARNSSIRTLDDFFSKAEAETKKANSRPQKSTETNRDGTISTSTLTWVDKPISRNQNVISFESSKLVATKTSRKSVSKPNFMGQVKEEITPLEAPPGEDVCIGYFLNMIVDLGGGEFRKYVYYAEKIVPSEAEKTYLLQLFEYMEAQIKNVSV